MDPKELDLVEQSEENEVLDDFGFSEAYGYSYDEYEEEWNESTPHSFFYFLCFFYPSVCVASAHISCFQSISSVFCWNFRQLC